MAGEPRRKHQQRLLPFLLVPSASRPSSSPSRRSMFRLLQKQITECILIYASGRFPDAKALHVTHLNRVSMKHLCSVYRQSFVD